MTHEYVIAAWLTVGLFSVLGLLSLAASLAYDWRRGGRR